MPWTQTDIDKLKAAMASGAKTCQFADQVITLHDVDANLKLLSVMQAEVSAASLTGTPRTRYAATRKGL